MGTNDFDKRLKALEIAYILVIVVLIARLGYLQVYAGEHYARLADGNRIRVIPMVAPRGNIYDRNGVPLVDNRPGFTVSLLPLLEPVSDEVITRLSSLLKINKEDIIAKIDSHIGLDPIRIKMDVSQEIITIIEEQRHKYSGVVIEVQPIRRYLHNEEGVHVYGYVSEISDEELKRRKKDGYKIGDMIGKFGLERYYDRDIRGVDGGEHVEVDVSGKPIQILGEKIPVPGNDFYLTIDRNIQQAVEKAIDEHLAIIDANAAAVVVMNPQTGEILALASRPAFNPNLFVNGISFKDWELINENPYYPLDNKAITGEYPPGSTFKIVTGVAALDSGVIKAEEKVNDTGVFHIDEKTNAGGEVLGWINFDQAMAHSDNFYFYEVGYRMGITKLEEYARRFGLGAKTGINLPFESEGVVASPLYKEKIYPDSEWYDGETIDAAIGQGFNLVTPLQAAMIMSMVAADGNGYKPHIVKKIVAADGKLVKEFTAEKVSSLNVPMSVIKHVQTGLNGVIKYGTAASNFLGFPINLAGKTGTAENPHGEDHGWFVAYGPFENPQVVVAVLVEQGGYGAVSAVPIGRRILESIFLPPVEKKVSQTPKK